MALISISGIGKAKKPKQTKAQKKAKVLVAKKKILNKIKKTGKVAVKYNPLVATARNSFLTLVSLNVFNLAKRLNIMLVKNPQKLMKFWTSLSGKFSALQNAINTGKNKKAIVGNPVAVAVATATPILIKVMKFLEENGISKDDIKKAVNVVVAKAIDKKITTEAVKEVEEEEAKEEEQQTSEENPEQTTEETPEQTTEETPEENNTDNEQIGYYC